MKKKYLIFTLVHLMVFPISCAFKRNNPIDEGGDNFDPPKITIDDTTTSFQNRDTVHFDSVTITLIGNREQSLFSMNLDDSLWSLDWQPEGTFGIGGLKDGEHTLYINTMYRGGTIVISDTVKFHVLTKGFKPEFKEEDDSTVASFGGKSVKLKTSVEGASPLQYSWLKSDSVLAGKNKDSLVFYSFTIKDTGSYKSVVSNEYGIDTSRTFILSFRPSTGGIKGIVTDIAEKILKGAKVALSPSDKQVTTGSDGKFEFSALSAESYTLKVTLNGYEDKTVDDIGVNDSDVVDIKGIELEWIDTTTYKVVYNGNGNDSGEVPIDSTKYKPESKVVVLGNTGNLSLKGYTFLKWNTKKDGSGDNFNSEDSFTITDNVTLYAHWKVNSHTLSFSGNNSTSGDAPADKEYDYNEKVTVPDKDSLKRAGYTFEGWNTQQNGEGQAYAAKDTFSMPDSSVVLFAQWEAMATFKVTYNSNDADSGTVPVDNDSYYEGKEVTVAGNTGKLFRDGFFFAGWNTKADGTGDSYNAGSKFSMPDSAVTLYVKWSTNPTYSIIYHGNTNTGGDEPSTVESDSDEIVTIADSGSLVKTGHAFVEWNTKEDGSGTAYTIGQQVTMDTVDIELYAQWKARYKIIYHGNSSTGGNVPSTVECDSGETIVVADSGTLVKTGHAFVEWDTKEDGSGSTFSIGQQITISAVNIDLYAQWTKKQYTITYHGNGSTGGTVPSKTKHLYQTEINVSDIEDLEKDGYFFVGWNTDSLGNGLDYSIGASLIIEAGDVDLYARWSIKKYTVSFNSNGGDAITSQSINHNDTVSFPNEPSKQSYIFDGWFQDPTFQQPWDFKTKITDTLTLHAKWIIKDIDGNQYTDIQIGNQVWLVENLMTSRYTDSTAIPIVVENDVWANLSTPAYCWYPDVYSANKKYGALYNWYVVDPENQKQVAPDGWRVPTDDDFNELITFLGGTSTAGSDLKEAGTTHWSEPNSDATNSSGFTALPAGMRYYDGGFQSIATNSNWWTTTLHSSDYPFRYGINCYNGNVMRIDSNHRYGYSIRCIRNW